MFTQHSPSPVMKFEDIEIGTETTSPPRHVSRDEIIGFAERYDRQPMHLEGAGALPDALFDDVIASGFMTLALTWQLWLDCGLQGADGRGGLGIRDCRWRRALRPDSTIQGHFVVTDKRVSSGGHGIVTYSMKLLEIDHADTDDDCLVEFTTVGIMARRSRDRGE